MKHKGSEIKKLENFIRHAWRKRWWLLGVQVLAAAVAFTVFQSLPRLYRSRTTIRVERESVINPLTQGRVVSSQVEELLGTLQQEIYSRSHIEEVISHLELESPDADPAGHEALVRKITNKIYVNVPRATSRRSPSSIFHIAYSGEDPVVVRDVTDALSSLFIEKNLAGKRSESDAAYEFIKDQLEVYRQKLEKSENALRRFEEQHMDEMPETRASNLARLESMKASLAEIRHNISQARIQKDLLIKRIPGEAVTAAGEERTVPDPLIDTLREKEDELRQLKRSYSDNYPDVISLRTEIEDLRAEVELNPVVPAAEVPSTAPTTVETSILNQLQQIDVEIESLTTRIPLLEEEIAEYQNKVSSIPQQEQELHRLQRDYDVNSSIYEMFLRRSEEARVSLELEDSQKGDTFRIVDRAALPLSPYSPNRRQAFMLGILAGLVLNLVVVYWFWSSDTSLGSAREAEEYLGLSVMARIPRIHSRKEKVANWLSGIFFAGVCGLFAVLYLGAFYWQRVLFILGGGQ